MSNPARPVLFSLLLALLPMAGCSSMPTAGDIRASQASPLDGDDPALDARARFRNVFCSLALQSGKVPITQTTACGGLLWRLSDEPAEITAFHLPPLDPRLRVFLVGGVFSDCFGEASIAYRTGIERLAAKGVYIRTVPISSRSSSGYNAEVLARSLREAALAPGDDVVLLGYSKGTVDILEFLVNHPEQAELVDAVINVAGPVHGSLVAQKSAWFYNTFLAGAFAGRCPPGDRGVVDSLVPQTREHWMATHALPAQVRYYSLLGFTTRAHLALGLVPSWNILAAIDTRNDGQVAPVEGWLPGSTLLGFANADHWGLAIDIEDELPTIAGRPDPTPFPRDILFESLLRYVSQDLDRRSAQRH